MGSPHFVSILSHLCNSELEELPTTELIALILGVPTRRLGSGSDPGLGNLVELSRAGPRELVEEHGLGLRSARRLTAAFALGRRLARAERPARPSLRSAERVYRLLGDDMRGLEQEVFMVCLLDGKHALRQTVTVSLGTLTSSLVHPREVFRPALRAAAGAVVCAHNHPSGDPEPSPEDLQITRRLVQAGKLLGIPVLDHVVIGDGRYVSLRERLRF